MLLAEQLTRQVHGNRGLARSALKIGYGHESDHRDEYTAFPQ
jgi:hypothetical protein